jgi:hypothetical protein
MRPVQRRPKADQPAATAPKVLLGRLPKSGMAEEEAGGEMSDHPWIVLDANKQEMRCEHCKSSEPLSLIEGRRLDFAVGILNAFADLHKECTP